MKRGSRNFFPFFLVVWNVGNGGSEKSSALLDKESDSIKEFTSPRRQSIKLDEAYTPYNWPCL